MNQTKIDTLSKAQTRKMTPYAREEQKLNTYLIPDHKEISLGNLRGARDRGNSIIRRPVIQKR